MKESRYRQSGKTQRNGVTATSSHSKFVVASSMAEPQAASDAQTIRMPRLGRCESCNGWADSVAVCETTARQMTTYKPAKAANKIFQSQASCRKVSNHPRRYG